MKLRSITFAAREAACLLNGDPSRNAQRDCVFRRGWRPASDRHGRRASINAIMKGKLAAERGEKTLAFRDIYGIITK